MSHQPVLLKEVLDALQPKDKDVIVDGTFGRGGYSRAILNVADCQVYGIDRDPQAVEAGKKLEEENKRFHMLQGKFGDMNKLLNEVSISKVNAIVLDIGVSSPQIDQAERGFSFSKDGPLDMRMSLEGESAADLVNTLSEEELANILYTFGEERKSRWIAKKIVQVRKEKAITTTKQLAEVIYSVLPKRGPGIDPATRTFQALRIKVNNELGELEKGLEESEKLLSADGRLAVVSFHSLEDRCVKTYFKTHSEKKQNSGYRHWPDLPGEGSEPTFTLVNKKAIKASDEESRLNPRARSAKLRWGIRNSVNIEGDLS